MSNKLKNHFISKIKDRITVRKFYNKIAKEK